jgi:hypothetical protein
MPFYKFQIVFNFIYFFRFILLNPFCTPDPRLVTWSILVGLLDFNKMRWIYMARHCTLYCRLLYKQHTRLTCSTEKIRKLLIKRLECTMTPHSTRIHSIILDAIYLLFMKLFSRRFRRQSLWMLNLLFFFWISVRNHEIYKSDRQNVVYRKKGETPNIICISSRATDE